MKPNFEQFKIETTRAAKFTARARRGSLKVGDVIEVSGQAFVITKAEPTGYFMDVEGIETIKDVVDLRKAK